MTTSFLLPALDGPTAKADYANMTRPPRIAMRMIAVVALLVFGLLVVASQTPIPAVVRAPGAIMPQGSYVAIETMDGGIVEAVLAHDGDHVEAGHVLVRLHHPTLARDHATLVEQIAAAEHRLANAEARVAVFDADAAPTAADVLRLRAAGLLTAASSLQVFVESQRIQSNTIEEQRAIVAHLVDAVSFAETRIQGQQDLVAQQSSLFEQGLTVRDAFVAEVRYLDDLLSRSADASLRLAEARSALAVAEAALQQERLALLQAALLDRQQISQDLAELRASVAIVAERLDALTITAPVDGVVQASVFAHPGAVIEPGETVFELLPEDQTLVVEVRIPEDAIGQVAEGQRVAVTVDTFDLRQFGRAQGRLVTVSPASLRDAETGSAYFRAFVELESAVIGEGAFQRDLQAGMTTVAEISSGEQSLLAVLLGPIHRTVQTAFTENL